MVIKVGRVGTYSVNVGRPTPLGNPFYMHDESKRNDVCDKYEVWFAAKVAKNDKPVMDQLNFLLEETKRKGKITLGCYCSPKRCHADTIAKYLTEQLKV